jgi:lipopolysaccharide transport system ATP-binding protein
MSAIGFDRVSKRFTLQRERPRSFQELFLNLLRLRGSHSRERYWALRDVSFGIEPGETVGIVGDNGAGKSTLLKLVCRIIEPSTGSIAVDGRVSALLELGAGFHPDLTGRENVYLNGSILGLGKAEVDQVFDDILSFSEMERFIDSPVKHYSSGMYMRLGFSIAIHVRPDILLVDEVLAVGDQAFQLRCLDKINEMKRQGITIVLVTHNLETVRDLCTRAIWLDQGQIRAEGAVDNVIEHYLTEVWATDRHALQQAEAMRRGNGQTGSEDEGGPALETDQSLWRWGSREAEIVSVQLLDSQGQERRSFQTGEKLVIRIHFNAKQRVEGPQFGIALFHPSGFHINGPNTALSGMDIEAIEGEGYVDHVIDNLPLLPGTYLSSISIYDREGVHAYDFHHQAYTFRVRPSASVQEKYGSFLIPSSWQMGPSGLLDGSPATGRKP